MRLRLIWLAGIAALIIGACGVLGFSKQQTLDTESTSHVQTYAEQKSAIAEFALKASDKKVGLSGNHHFQMRNSMWDVKTDKVEKQTSLTIPLEDRKGEITGLFQIGCDREPVRAIFLRVGVSKRLGLFGKKGNKEIAQFNEGYRVGTNAYANVSESGDYSFARFYGANRGVSVTDPETYGVEEARNIAEMIRRIHRSKLTFKLSPNFGDGSSPSLTIEGPTSISDAHSKLFESVAAYCIDLTN